MNIAPKQRFTPTSPCPICGGHDRLPRGQGTRCHGFLSQDRRFAHCTREDHAGALQINSNSGTYGHRLEGPCDCGVTHGKTLVPRIGRGQVLRDEHFALCPEPYPADYRDETGKVLFRIARWRRRDGTKTYSVHHSDGSGGWLPGRGSSPRAIFRLPETRAAIERGVTVFIVEGEKCVYALLALGLCATTNDSGAGKWGTEHSIGLRGAQRAVILRDEDSPGRKHAEQVARAMHEAGVPDIRLPKLPGLAEGEDVADWLARRQPEAEPTVLRAELERIVEETPGWRPPPARLRHAEKGREQQGRALDFGDVEPWGEAVDGAAALDEIVSAIQRYIVLPVAAAHTVALWVAMTWCIDYVLFAVRLIVTSPTRACGKTNLIAILTVLVRRSLSASSATAAALFRAIEVWSPTLLLDEMDNARLAENGDLRAILNSGHSRSAARTLRTVGEHHESRWFSTWCAMAIAAIGELPDTVASRGVPIRLHRKPPTAQVERPREMRLLAELEPLRQKLARWAADHGPGLADADPALPEILDGRAADNWSVLVAVADAAGGEWPQRARAAALALEVGRADAVAAGEMLLADLRELFDGRAADRLASVEIVRALGEREDRPWSEWRQGKAITQRQLANLLRPFEILPGTVWPTSDKSARGYYRSQFEEAWDRYLRSTDPSSDPTAQQDRHEDPSEPDSSSDRTESGCRIGSAVPSAFGTPTVALSGRASNSADDGAGGGNPAVTEESPGANPSSNDGGEATQQ